MCIVDRQRPLSTSGTRACTPWFISFPTSARRGRLAERWARYRHVCKTTFGTFYGETTRKNLRKNNFIHHPLQTHYHHRLIIIALDVVFSYLLIFDAPSMAGKAVFHPLGPFDEDGLREFLMTCIRLPSTKAICHCQIVESPNISFPNATIINAVVSLCVFLKSTQNLIAQHCSTDTSIFSEYSATHCLAIHACSALYARFFFFLHIDCCAVHICSYILVYFISRTIVFSLSPHAQSLAIRMCKHAFR